MRFKIENLKSSIVNRTSFVILYVVTVAGEKVFGKEAMGGGDIRRFAIGAVQNRKSEIVNRTSYRQPFGLFSYQKGRTKMMAPHGDRPA